MTDLQASFAATLVDELVRGGLREAVLCPGSRSTPLAVAFAEDGRVRLHVVLDERSAGFFAVGVGMATGQAAAVVTTSGTAAVELHPAVVEAHQAGVPLLAITADRPAELHGVGAPQTVVQSGLYGGATRWSVDIGVPDEAGRPAWRSLAARALAATARGPGGPGPVHMNVAFREPLLGGGPVVRAPGRKEDGAWHGVRAASAAGRAAPAELVADWAGAGARGVIVAGGGVDDPDSVLAMAAALGWPVLADPRSGCRQPVPMTVAAADALLRVEAFTAAARPEVVVRVGAPWASRVVGEWLAGLGGDQWLVDPHGQWRDPARTASVVIDATPGTFCRAVADAATGGSAGAVPDGWLGLWQGAEAAAQAAFDAVFDRHPEVTEPGVARALTAGLPLGAQLVVSSSMPVRDVEWYGRARGGLRVLANRGANGIDGVVSTVVGAASASAVPTVGLLGDLAFLHDINGLLAARGTGTGTDCALVVVDNDGGGIFSFLPQRGELGAARFERLFATPHGLNLRTVAAAYGVEAVRVTAAAEVVPAVMAALRGGGVRMVHVRTDREANVAVHDELHAAAAAAVERTLAG